ncbi:TFIIB-type zinc ribbon-containing protein [Halovenus rubra]|uniref:TFIIB-type zinc ribbon-containing protein n=2 Tax=Halovenus rubra TaxID=869890 RepID=A0ABD5X1Z6_9EURY|nr:TFIIB-type zinc ribbon-containing protein [Halovenus rubra]
MEVRGERECQSCGSQWSYYETDEITCPNCGSVRSVSLDEPTTHTARDVTLDLTAIRNDISAVSVETLADEASETVRSYLRQVGFVKAGELQPLEETVVAAAELRRVAVTLGRVMRVEDNEELYFLELLKLADQNERPNPEDVPETLYSERGLGVAASIDMYTTDIGRVYEQRDTDVDRVLSSVRSRRKRIEALDGEVEPEEAEQLLRAVRDVSAYLRESDETALARALERF